MKIHDLAKSQQPRERLIQNGVASLSDAELVSIVLGQGSKDENVIQLAQRLLSDNTIKKLSRLRISQITKTKGIGPAKACQIIACFELGRRVSVFQNSDKIAIQNAHDIFKLFSAQLEGVTQEYFIGVYLDTRKRILKYETIFVGTLNATIVHPREIFSIALHEKADSLIIVHNHPSGDPTPSSADFETTKVISNAGKIIGIELIDHVIIGHNRYYSFRENKDM